MESITPTPEQISEFESMIKKHLHDNCTPKCKICKYIKDCEEIGDAYCYGLCENLCDKCEDDECFYKTKED